LAEYLYRLAGTDYLDSRDPPVGYKHPNGFSKIRLVGLTDYGWAVRLHVWDGGSSDRDIHSHRWPFASYVLSGSLIERRYESNSGMGQWIKYDCGRSVDGLYALRNPQACNVSLIAEDTYQSGSSYKGNAEALHLAMTGGGAHPTVTLFIQGSERKKSSTVIKPKCPAVNANHPVAQYRTQELVDLLKVVLNIICQ
jgi:hypothetical protein